MPQPTARNTNTVYHVTKDECGKQCLKTISKTCLNISDPNGGFMGQEEIQFFEEVHLDLYQIWEGRRVWEQEAGIQSCKSHWFLSYKVGKPHVKRPEFYSSSFSQAVLFKI